LDEPFGLMNRIGGSSCCEMHTLFIRTSRLELSLK